MSNISGLATIEGNTARSAKQASDEHATVVEDERGTTRVPAGGRADKRREHEVHQPSKTGGGGGGCVGRRGGGGGEGGGERGSVPSWPFGPLDSGNKSKLIESWLTTQDIPTGDGGDIWSRLLVLGLVPANSWVCAHNLSFLPRGFTAAPDSTGRTRSQGLPTPMGFGCGVILNVARKCDSTFRASPFSSDTPHRHGASKTVRVESMMD